MEASKAALDTIKSNILISSIFLVLVLVIAFLLYKSAPLTINKKAEPMSNDEKELNKLLDQLEKAQSS